MLVMDHRLNMQVYGRLVCYLEIICKTFHLWAKIKIVVRYNILLHMSNHISVGFGCFSDYICE